MSANYFIKAYIKIINKNTTLTIYVDVFIRIWVFLELWFYLILSSVCLLATAWSISKISAFRALWERIGSSQNLICGKERPELHQTATFLLKFLFFCTQTHTKSPQQQQGNSANSLWQQTKGNQSLLLNDAKRYDKKCIISLSYRVRLHTHPCGCAHTHIT